jgi:hypothetical protein
MRADNGDPQNHWHFLILITWSAGDKRKARCYEPGLPRKAKTAPNM